MSYPAHKTALQNHTKYAWFYPLNSNGKEKDYESGFHYYGARYYWSEVLTGWLSVDPMADKYPSISPYAYCAWNPVRLVDPDGNTMTDFQDKDGNLIMHVDDESNAVFRLTGTSPANEYFAFVGFSNQGGINAICITGLVAGAQEYALDNQKYCNQAVNFVGRTYVEAYNAVGWDVNGGEIFRQGLSADKIAKEFGDYRCPYVMKEKSNYSIVQNESYKGAFVVGVAKGHVCMVSTKDYEITLYAGGHTTKQNHRGGMTININGGTTIGRGPNNNNSSYKLDYAFADGWYIIRPITYHLKPVEITAEQLCP